MNFELDTVDRSLTLPFGPSYIALILPSGKSVICSKIVEHVQNITGMVVIFYFCHHHQNSQSQANEVLRTFTTQLLAANTELAPYILETFANNGLKPTKKHLGVILEKMIASFTAVRIVVDGLDECPQSDQDEIIQDLLSIKGVTPGACKVLLSSRKLSSISRFLEARPTIRLDDNAGNVNSTISSFVHSQLELLRQKFDPIMIDELGRQILAKANGESLRPLHSHPLI